MMHLFPRDPIAQDVQYVTVKPNFRDIEYHIANDVFEVYVANDGTGFVKYYQMVHGDMHEFVSYGRIEIVFKTQSQPVVPKETPEEISATRKVRIR